MKRKIVATFLLGIAVVGSVAVILSETELADEGKPDLGQVDGRPGPASKVLAIPARPKRVGRRPRANTATTEVTPVTQQVRHSLWQTVISKRAVDHLMEGLRLKSKDEPLLPFERRGEIDDEDVGEKADLLSLAYEGCVVALQSGITIDGETNFWFEFASNPAYTNEQRNEVLEMVDDMAVQHKRCAALDVQAARRQHYDWLSLAMYNEYPLAVINFVVHAKSFLLELAMREPAYIDAYRSDAIAALNFGIRSGNPLAFHTYAMQRATGELLAQDFFEVLVYAEAARLAGAEFVSEVSRSSIILERVEVLIAIGEEHLSLSERAAARREARIICGAKCVQ